MDSERLELLRNQIDTYLAENYIGESLAPEALEPGIETQFSIAPAYHVSKEDYRKERDLPPTPQYSISPPCPAPNTTGNGSAKPKDLHESLASALPSAEDYEDDYPDLRCRYSIAPEPLSTEEADDEDDIDRSFEDILNIFRRRETRAERKEQIEEPVFEDFTTARTVGEYLTDQEDAETFTEYMLRVIRERDLRESDVYNRVFMDRKLFNKIRNDPGYQPSKKTALLLALALRLTLRETQEFIGKAGYIMSHSSKTDLIVEFFIVKGNYNVMEINEMLDEYHMPLLFKCD